jgi:hypothetical protein
MSSARTTIRRPPLHTGQFPDVSQIAPPAAPPVEVHIRRVVRIVDRVRVAKVSIRRKLVEHLLGPVQGRPGTGTNGPPLAA